MNLFIYIFASAVCLTVAHYGGYESRNQIIREEPHDMAGLVECPVCEFSVSWLPPREECNITINKKTYKKCNMGKYINSVCGNRMDCFRGPGEQCTESMQNDYYGQRCAYGYNCDDTHVCTGYGFTVNSHMRWLLKHVSSFPIQNEEDKPLYLA